MLSRNEQIEREAKSARLREARLNANIGSYRKLANRFGWNENTYKSHESGRGFGLSDAKRYAKAFKVSLNWLYLGVGEASDDDNAPVSALDVPLVDWISAGALSEHEGVTDFGESPTIPALDLPEGDWIALKVQGDSMNKISPPGSIIFVNRRDKRLAPNACYVVATENGDATYKRYRPTEDPIFQPVSYNEIEPPDFDGPVTVIGRVRRSVIEM